MGEARAARGARTTRSLSSEPLDLQHAHHTPLIDSCTGGFIACRVAQLLARQRRLASLYVSATSRGMRWWPKLSTRVFRWLLPYTIKPAEKMVCGG